MFKIGGLSLKKISGQVSFTYLSPTQEAIEKLAEKGITLPMIILIGDQHGSETNQCEPCEEKMGCYSIDSDTLLRQFDTLAESYNVDFYIEHAKDKEYINKEGVMSRFLKKTLGCYDSEKKALSCDYKNIRWHYADSRFWKGSVEHMASEGSEYLAKGRAKLFFERSDNPLFLEFIKSLLYSVEHDESFDYLSLRIASSLEEQMLEDENSKVYQQMKTYNIGINVLAYCMLCLKSHGASGVNKVKEDYGWMTRFLTPICEYMTTGRRPGDIEFAYEYYRIVIDKIYYLWVRYTSCFLDLYFLGRMLKPSRQSHVTLAFLGHSHIKSIIEFLVPHKNWYHIRHSRDHIENDRCIRLKKDIDFDRELEEYISG
jgi:hypothetical protein